MINVAANPVICSVASESLARHCDLLAEEVHTVLTIA